MAICVCAGVVAGGAESADTASNWRLTAAMDPVVHVDEPFTLRVRLWNLGAESTAVLIVHHREEQMPFQAAFESLTRESRYRAWLARGEDKGIVVSSYYVAYCENPRRPRGPDCPPLRNLYEVDGGAYVEFAEVVRLGDYATWLSEWYDDSFTGFVAGPHLLEVSVRFIEDPEPHLLDRRNSIDRPFTELATEVVFEVETGVR